MSIQNAVLNVVFMTCIIYNNVRTGRYIRKIRQTMVMSADETIDYKRETKLFIQCFVTTCLFCFFGVCFVIFNTFALGSHSKHVCFFVSTVWLVHHSLNCLIYVLINTQLRKDIAFVLRSCFCRSHVVDQPTTIPVVNPQNTAQPDVASAPRNRGNLQMITIPVPGYKDHN